MPRRPLSFSGRAGDLQQRREQALRETVEERETRLQRMRLNQRLRLVSETQEERETRLQRMGQRTVSRRLGRTERPAFDECSRGWHLRLLRTERPAFNKCVSTSRRGWHLRLLRTETHLQQMCINKHQRLASETTFLQGLTQVKEMLIISSHAHYLHLPSTPWAVRLQWSCYQPASRCPVLCIYSKGSPHNACISTSNACNMIFHIQPGMLLGVCTLLQSLGRALASPF